MSIYVHLLPSLFQPDDLRDQVAVVVDVLRATTTVAAALAAGARAIIPCQELDEARSLSAATSPPRLIGGERHGQPVPGFDLGNSPSEYRPEVVRGREIVLSTTNGTRAMERCRAARLVYLGAFVNRSAIVRALLNESTVHVVCSGTHGHVTQEDVLLAGALVAGWQGGHASLGNDSAAISLAAWQQICRQQPGAEGLLAALRESQGARELLQLGLDDDLQFAADLDRFDATPRLDTHCWRIEAL